MRVSTHAKASTALLAALIWAFAALGAPVSLETARGVAQKHLERTRGGSIKPAQKPQMKASAGVSAPPYFVIEKEKYGFVIVAADDIAVPVLGETDWGVFDKDSMPPALLWLLGTYEEQIAQALKNGAAQDDETKKLWKQATSSSGLAMAASYPTNLLSTMWSQDDPYWSNTPKIGTSQTPTGCVATVMAQIMNFYKYPARTTGTIPAYTTDSRLSVSALPAVTFDWSNMLDKYGFYPATDGGGTHTDKEGNRYYEAKWNGVQGQAVATLMSAAGRAVKMNYGKESSGAESKEVASALTAYFGYDSSIRFVRLTGRLVNNSVITVSDISASDWKELVIGQIENNSPVYYSGVNTVTDGGHAFIIDGYNDVTDIFHLNWGWGGRYNGFFPLTALNPKDGERYNSFHDMVINIMPNKNGSPPSQIKVSRFDADVSAAESALNANVRAKMNYGADFSGKIGLAVMSGNTIKAVLDSANYSISNTYIPSTGKYTVKYEDAALKWRFGANIPLWAELSGSQTVQLVAKRGAGAWAAVGNSKTVSIPGIYMVTFNANGGAVTPAFGATGVGGRLSALPTPTRDGYFFEGWWTSEAGGAEITIDKVYSGNATIYARWTPIFKVTFNADGGIVTPASGTTGAGGRLSELPTPTREGYFFGGWFTERAGGAAVTINYVYSGNATIYARWKPEPVILINGVAGGANPRVGDTLTAGGSVSNYAWKLGGAAVGAANKPYVVAAEDIGGAITLEVTESGDVYAAKTAPVLKYAVPERPDSPNIEYVTYSAVKLTETTGYEYAIDARGVKKWQKASLFAGLTPNTQYTFYQRAAETNTAYASPASFESGARTAARPALPGINKILVKLRNRPEVPEVKFAEEAAADSRLAGEFTAGPNPIAKQSGIVNFYRQGKQIAICELRVYDAYGNVINKVKISDAAGGRSRRQVGSWDLRDAKGRPVSEGTYLLRGTVKTSDGKTEKVSLILGVRQAVSK